MIKIGFLNFRNSGNLVVYYDEKAKINPYRIYMETYYIDKHEYPTKHRKLIERYANLASCTAHIHNFTIQHDEEKR